MELVSTVVLHVLYFLVAAVSAAFLHTPPFSRLVLLLLVPLNAWVAIHRGESLGFAAMTMFILLTVAGGFLFLYHESVFLCMCVCPHLCQFYMYQANILHVIRIVCRFRFIYPGVKTVVGSIFHPAMNGFCHMLKFCYITA